jgi:hypothetical protein
MGREQKREPSLSRYVGFRRPRNHGECEIACLMFWERGERGRHCHMFHTRSF